MSHFGPDGSWPGGTFLPVVSTPHRPFYSLSDGSERAVSMKYTLLIRWDGRVIFDQVGYADLKAAMDAATFIIMQDEKCNDRANEGENHKYAVEIKPQP